MESTWWRERSVSSLSIFYNEHNSFCSRNVTAFLAWLKQTSVLLRVGGLHALLLPDTGLVLNTNSLMSIHLSLRAGTKWAKASPLLRRPGCCCCVSVPNVPSLVRLQHCWTLCVGVTTWASAQRATLILPCLTKADYRLRRASGWTRGGCYGYGNQSSNDQNAPTVGTFF